MEFSGTFGKAIHITGRSIYNILDSRIYINYPEEENRILSFSGIGESGVSFALPRLPRRDNSIIYYNTINYSIITGIKYIDLPFISGFTPSSGTWGDIIRVSGKEFIEVTGVFVDGKSSENFYTSGENNLFFSIPDASETSFVEVRTTGGIVSTSFSGISNTGSFTGNLSIIIPPISISGFTPDQAKYNQEIFVTGRSLQKVNQITLTGIRDQISMTEIDHLGTTGIKFRLPTGVLTENKFILSNVGFVSGEDVIIATGFEVVETSDPLYITGYSIINIVDNTGRYLDVIPVSGTNMNGRKFFFQGYTISGEIPNYIESSGYNYVSDILTELTVPSEIIRGPIYISGEDGLIASEDYFTPIPTIFELTPASLTIGTPFRAKARNATEIYNILGISGFNQYERKTGVYLICNNEFSSISSGANSNVSDDYFGNFYLNFDALHDKYPSGTKTGHVLISGIVNNSFIGTGFAFLTSKKAYLNEFDLDDLSDIILLENSLKSGSDIPNFAESLTPFVVKVDPKIPIISGFAERVGRSGILEITGKYLMSSTGFSLGSLFEDKTINSDNFVIDSGNNIVRKVRTSASQSNVYEYEQRIRIRTQDFGFTGKSGIASILTAYSDPPVEGSETIGSITTFATVGELNAAFAGAEIKTFNLLDTKTGLCLKTLDVPAGYADNIGSSRFRLVWTGEYFIDYGNLTVTDVTTEGGVDSCWGGVFPPLPTGSYGKYRISFISGDFSPNGGALYDVGLFTFSKY